MFKILILSQYRVGDTLVFYLETDATNLIIYTLKSLKSHKSMIASCFQCFRLEIQMSIHKE